MKKYRKGEIKIKTFSDEELTELGLTLKWGVRKELKIFPALIASNEEVLFLDQFYIKSKLNLVVITSERILLLYKENLNLIKLKDIYDIKYEKKFLGCMLNILQINNIIFEIDVGNEYKAIKLKSLIQNIKPRTISLKTQNEHPVSDWDLIWPINTHQTSGQKSRQTRSSTVTLSNIDFINKTAMVEGSNGIYLVSLGKCTCPDFEERQLPCKHMYKLAHELGFLDIYDSAYASGIYHEDENSGDEDDIPSFHEVRIAKEPFWGTEKELTEKFNQYRKSRDLFFVELPRECFEEVMSFIEDKIPEGMNFEISQRDRFYSMHIAGTPKKILCKFYYSWEGIEIEPTGGSREVICEEGCDFYILSDKTENELLNILNILLNSNSNSKQKINNIITTELEQLYNLKEKGVISEKEFIKAKSKLLS